MNSYRADIVYVLILCRPKAGTVVHIHLLPLFDEDVCLDSEREGIMRQRLAIGVLAIVGEAHLTNIHTRNV